VTTRISTPYSAQTTADEIVSGLDLTGQRIIVTGGASGIGIETARSLAAAGAEITLAVRNLDAGRQVAAQLAAGTSSKQVLVAPLDLADQEPSVAGQWPAGPASLGCHPCLTRPSLPGWSNCASIARPR
jgi:NAD(P)-dependent dehydrogenase (short-subunit alcohol dehydrogenase family)